MTTVEETKRALRQGAQQGAGELVKSCMGGVLKSNKTKKEKLLVAKKCRKQFGDELRLLTGGANVSDVEESVAAVGYQESEAADVMKACMEDSTTENTTQLKICKLKVRNAISDVASAVWNGTTTNLDVQRALIGGATKSAADLARACKEVNSSGCNATVAFDKASGFVLNESRETQEMHEVAVGRAVSVQLFAEQARSCLGEGGNMTSCVENASAATEAVRDSKDAVADMRDGVEKSAMVDAAACMQGQSSSNTTAKDGCTKILLALMQQFDVNASDGRRRLGSSDWNERRKKTAVADVLLRHSAEWAKEAVGCDASEKDSCQKNVTETMRKFINKNQTASYARFGVLRAVAEKMSDAEKAGMSEAESEEIGKNECRRHEACPEWDAIKSRCKRVSKARRHGHKMAKLIVKRLHSLDIDLVVDGKCLTSDELKAAIKAAVAKKAANDVDTSDMTELVKPRVFSSNASRCIAAYRVKVKKEANVSQVVEKMKDLGASMQLPAAASGRRMLRATTGVSTDVSQTVVEESGDAASFDATYNSSQAEDSSSNTGVIIGIVVVVLVVIAVIAFFVTKNQDNGKEIDEPAPPHPAQQAQRAQRSQQAPSQQAIDPMTKQMALRASANQRRAMTPPRNARP